MPMATGTSKKNFGYNVPLAKSDEAKEHLPLMNIVIQLLNYFSLVDGTHFNSSLQVGSTHFQNLEVVRSLSWVGWEETADESCQTRLEKT
jgi:hypothetical protein